MRVSGRAGRLLHGYQQAATLGKWEFVSAERPGLPVEITARIVQVDEFWITQRPLDIELRVGDVEWRWEGAKVAVANGKATVEVVGRPLVERVTI